MVPLRIAAPLIAAFLLFLVMVVATVRGSPVSRTVPTLAGIAFVRRLIGTAMGGYATFILIVLVFHRLIAGQLDVMGAAAVRGAVLAFAVAIPTFVLLSWLEGFVRHAHDR
jgi:Family of unknown function (DUF6256)